MSRLSATFGGLFLGLQQLLSTRNSTRSNGRKWRCWPMLASSTPRLLLYQDFRRAIGGYAIHCLLRLRYYPLSFQPVAVHASCVASASTSSSIACKVLRNESFIQIANTSLSTVETFQPSRWYRFRR